MSAGNVITYDVIVGSAGIGDCNKNQKRGK